MSQPAERVSRPRVPGPPPPPKVDNVPPADPETVRQLYGEDAAAAHAAKTGGNGGVQTPTKRAAQDKDGQKIWGQAPGMPARNDYPDMADYLLAIPREYWDANRPEHVDAYLWKNRPTMAKSDGKPTSVEKLSGPIDTEYVRRLYGGFDYCLIVNYGQDCKAFSRKHASFVFFIDADPKPIAGRSYLQEVPASGFSSTAPAAGGGDGIARQLIEDQRSEIARLRSNNDAIDPQRRLAEAIELNKQALMNGGQNQVNPLEMLKEVGAIVERSNRAAMELLDKRLPVQNPGNLPAAPERRGDVLSDSIKALDFVDQVRERFGVGAAVEAGIPWGEIIKAGVQIAGNIATALSQRTQFETQLHAQQVAIENLQRQLSNPRRDNLRQMPDVVGPGTNPPQPLADQTGATTVATAGPIAQAPKSVDAVAASREFPDDAELAKDLPYQLVVHRTILRCIGTQDAEYNAEGKLAGMAALAVSPAVAKSLAELMQAANAQDDAAIQSLGEIMTWSPLAGMIEHPHRDQFVADFIEEVLGEDGDE